MKKIRGHLAKLLLGGALLTVVLAVPTSGASAHDSGYCGYGTDGAGWDKDTYAFKWFMGDGTEMHVYDHYNGFGANWVYRDSRICQPVGNYRPAP